MRRCSIWVDLHFDELLMCLQQFHHGRTIVISMDEHSRGGKSSAKMTKVSLLRIPPCNVHNRRYQFEVLICHMTVNDPVSVDKPSINLPNTITAEASRYIVLICTIACFFNTSSMETQIISIQNPTSDNSQSKAPHQYSDRSLASLWILSS